MSQMSRLSDRHTLMQPFGIVLFVAALATSSATVAVGAEAMVPERLCVSFKMGKVMEELRLRRA